VLAETVSADLHADMFAVLDQMEAAHPRYAHWYLPLPPAAGREAFGDSQRFGPVAVGLTAPRPQASPAVRGGRRCDAPLEPAKRGVRWTSPAAQSRDQSQHQLLGLASIRSADA
jgi:hypothetical protein